MLKFVAFVLSYFKLSYLFYIFFVNEGYSNVILYNHYTGYHLHSGLIEEIPCATSQNYCSLVTCSAQCRCVSDCVVINYNTATGHCQLHNRSALYSKDYDDGQSQWLVQEPQTAPPQIGEWKMVFRVTAGINVSAYNTYINSSHQDDHHTITSNVPAGCLTMNGSLFCDRHFRSRYLDTWTTRNISQVRVGMYSNGQIISSVTFNATGSDVNSWFDLSRVMTSSWVDLPEPNVTHNYFQIIGHSFRRFYINEHYHGCENDRGWMVVVDRPNGIICPWEESTSFPTLMTSAKNESVNWTNGRTLADVMAFMVKD